MFDTSILLAVIVIAIAMKQASSYTEACIGEFCFATPDSTELRNFDDAKAWCANNKSDLGVVNNSDVQLALTQFLNSSNTNEMTLINLKLYLRTHTWYLLNGSNYDGYVGNQDYDGYKLYCCLKSYGNNFQVDASKPSEINRYICDFEDTTRCLNNSTNNILYNGRCYVKYESETLTWFKARERCVNNGGDLATFQSRDISQLTTTWLNPSLTYWVGIRWNDRRWKSSDSGNEAIYTSWSTGKPNNNSNQCVCVDPNGNPAWSWTDCSCDDQRQFVCLKIVPTTSTTTITTTRATTMSTTSEVIAGYDPKSTANALILGLVLGIILPLIIVIIVLIIIIVHLRRQARDKPRSSESATAIVNPTFVQQDRSATELNATTADTNYQHLQRSSTPLMTTQPYEPLSQSEIRDYESASAVPNTTSVQQDRSATELNTTAADTQYQHLQKGSTPIRTTQLYEPLSQPEIRDYEYVLEMT